MRLRRCINMVAFSNREIRVLRKLVDEWYEIASENPDSPNLKSIKDISYKLEEPSRIYLDVEDDGPYQEQVEVS